MRARALAASVALVAASAVAFASTAQSAPAYHQPTGHAYRQNIVANDSKAIVFGEVKCYGGDGVLWASIKQGGKGDLTAEGSSSTARSWYDVHIPLNCNGVTHVVKAVLTKEGPNPGHPGAYRNLRDGIAWIQWCVTDSTFTGGSSGFSSFSSWRHVFQVS
jgi:hypothetical protein